MAFSERISVVIDVLTDKATSSLKNLKKDFQAAETVGQKFKVGMKAGFETLKQNAGQFAMAAGAALVAFGIKAVHAFEGTAKAALDLASATGLSTEQASRWVAVGDDFKVTAEQLASGIGKIGKSLDDPKWEKYGIATHDAAGEARDANDILVDSLATLSKVANETDRTRIGNELFGRGYANLAPLIGHTRSEYEQMLRSVEKGQVITDKEAAKAERIRLAEDKLADAFGEVTMAVGAFAADSAPAVEGMASLISKAVELEGKLGPLGDALEVALVPTTAPSKIADAFGPEVVARFDVATASLKELHAWIKSMEGVHGWTAESAAVLTREWEKLNGVVHEGTTGIMANGRFTDDAAAAMDRYGRQTSQARGIEDEFNKSIATTADQYSALLDLFSEEDAYDSVLDAFDDVKVAGMTAIAAVSGGTLDADKKQREYAKSVRDAKADVIAWADEVGDVPKEQVSTIMAAIDRNDFDEAKRLMAELTKTETKTINVKVANLIATAIKGVGGNATGTNYAEDAFIAGERGPELVTGRRGARVYNSAATSAMLSGAGGIQLHLNVSGNIYGDEALKQHLNAFIRDRQTLTRLVRETDMLRRGG